MNSYSEEQWRQIDSLGHRVEERLQRLEVGLTMGGEPTFVSLDDYESLPWRFTALGEGKRQKAAQLLKRLAARFCPGKGIRHYGIGKSYPGEDLPRWALGYFWRQDGVPLWQHPAWLAEEEQAGNYGLEDALRFSQSLARELGVQASCLLPAWEAETAEIVGYVLPLLPVWRQGQWRWSTCPWQLNEDRLYLLPGKAPLGLRLPLNRLDWAEELEEEAALPLTEKPSFRDSQPLASAPNAIRIALAVAVRRGTVSVFLPPLTGARNFVDLIAAIERAAAASQIPVRLEGYSPPLNAGLSGFQITPDPGVIEVNIHPAAHWQELVEIATILEEETRYCRLGREKYLLDGRRIDTGGGSHITIGGATVEESPLLRRPDLLRSLISYFQNHPSLSYLFAGLFVGPTSQAPRVDEARHESLYELEIAFPSLAAEAPPPPELVDALLRHLLVDVTGNPHRTAFCIDKLFPTDNPRQQLGLLEFRAFAMPPAKEMGLLQMLLLRALVAWFWEQPYTKPLIRWGTALHDRFLLPFYLAEDWQAVLRDLAEAGYPFAWDWFEPFFEFRFPFYGAINLRCPSGLALCLELRQAIEPWTVLGSAATSGGTSRPVDDSLERIQVRLRGALGHSPNGDTFSSRYAVTCNGHAVPLKSTGLPGDYVGGVRFRARQSPQSLHPTIAPHSPLILEVIDSWQACSLGGCAYHTSPPSGQPYERFPSHWQEAQSRRAERFLPCPPTAGPVQVSPPSLHPEYPLTLDLRRVVNFT